MGSLPVPLLTRPPGDSYGHYTLRTLRSSSDANSPWRPCGKAWLCSVCLLHAASHRQASCLSPLPGQSLQGRPWEMLILYTQLLYSSDLSWAEWKWICLTSWPIPKRCKQWWKKEKKDPCLVSVEGSVILLTMMSATSSQVLQKKQHRAHLRWPLLWSMIFCDFCHISLNISFSQHLRGKP